MRKVMKSKKYEGGGSTTSNNRPVQGPPKPKPLTPYGSKKPIGPPYAKPTPKPTAPVKPTQKTIPNPRTNPPTAMSNKQVVKKDGKTIVTYDSKKTGAFNLATYPAKVTKIYDKKGDLIRGNRRVQGSYGSSAMERIYDPKKKPAAKPTPKPAVKKPAPKKPVTTTYGPRTTEVLDYMKPSNTLATKPKPITPTKPKPITPAKPKPITPAKPAAKTVSELWTEKTGTSWSEAKKQGLSDGSAKSNMEIMKKLQSGAINKDTIATMKDNSKVATLSETKSETKSEAKPTAQQMSGSGMGAMERLEGMYKKGGSVKRKMKSKKK